MKAITQRLLQVTLLQALLLPLVTWPLLGQAPIEKVWDKRFGGSENDDLTSLIATPDGGYLLGGESQSEADGDKTEFSKGHWMVKLSADGDKVWDKVFGGSQGNELYTLIATSDGGYLLGGLSDSEAGGDKTEDSRGEYDYWVVKLNADGSKAWDKRFGGSELDWLTSMIATQDGGYLLGGWSLSGAGGDKTEDSRGQSDYWVVKLNADGSKAWDKRFGGSQGDHLTSLIATPDGGFLLGGESDSPTGGDKAEASRGETDYWVVKLNADGSKAWDKTLGGEFRDDLTSLTATADGGYLLGGYSWSGAEGDKSENRLGGADYWVVNLNADGSKAWDKTFGGNESDYLRSLIVTAEGGFLLGGDSDSGAGGAKTEASRGEWDYWVVKLNADGSKAWDKTLGGSSDDKLTSLIETADGGYLLGGRSRSGAGGDKTEPRRGNFEGTTDYWVVNIRESGVLSINAGIGAPGMKAMVYPNPSQGDVSLVVEGLPAPADALQVVLYNSLGHAVLRQRMDLGQVQAGVRLPTASLARGVYHLWLHTAGKVLSKKLIIN